MEDLISIFKNVLSTDDRLGSERGKKNKGKDNECWYRILQRETVIDELRDWNRIHVAKGSIKELKLMIYLC